MLLVDTLIVVGLSTISLGTIHESDGMQEHTFWLRNDGQKVITLMQGYTSCGCTTIHFNKDKAVTPGDSTSVTLRFNPRGKGGDFEETGTIAYTSNPVAPATTRKRLQLTLDGNCITSEETLLKQFPIRINDNLRLSTDHFDLGRMSVGETKERNIVILHRDQDNFQERIPISFTVTDKIGKGLQHIPYKITTKDNNHTSEFTIRLDVFIK